MRHDRHCLTGRLLRNDLCREECRMVGDKTRAGEQDSQDTPDVAVCGCDVPAYGNPLYFVGPGVNPVASRLAPAGIRIVSTLLLPDEPV